MSYDRNYCFELTTFLVTKDSTEIDPTDTGRCAAIPKSESINYETYPPVCIEKNNIAAYLENGEFWSVFQISKSIGDGHCFIYSLCKSYNTQFSDEPTLSGTELLDIIKIETTENYDYYVPYLNDGSFADLIKQMEIYVYDKIYDIRYGDIVPLIAANALKRDIFIITATSDDTHECEPVFSTAQCGERQPVYIHKHEDHYDALVPVITTVRCNNPISKKSHAQQGANLEMDTPCQEKINQNDDLNFTGSLKAFRASHPKNLITGHLNINSVRNKFVEISDLLTENLIDILFLSETKLDGSFPLPQFHVTGFKCHRADRNIHGGGIMAHVRSDLPHRRRTDLENIVIAPIEALILEVIIRKEKWLLTCLYNPNVKYKQNCCNSIEVILERSQAERFSMTFVMGDLNVNILNGSEAACLIDVMETHGLFNIVSEPTCFKSETPTLLDVILTNNTKRVGDSLNNGNGVSDFHNFICFSTKIQVPRKLQNVLTYRSYKHFDASQFKHDLSSAPYHVAKIFDDFDDEYWFINELMVDVIDSHAPIKRRKPVNNPVPFMNAKLRKACHTKSMARNKYFKCGRTKILWECFRKARNAATKIKATSMRQYFDDRCNSKHLNGSSKQFWNTIKPFVTDKVRTKYDHITLKVNDSIENEPSAVCNIFNEYFSNVASEIGNENSIDDNESIESVVKSYDEHQSIKLIREVTKSTPFSFDFQMVCESDIKSILDNIDSTKGPGYDAIPPKLIKEAANELTFPITLLVNESLRRRHFPHGLKMAELTPLFKTSDSLIAGNYRPVSILVCLSKVMEYVYHKQLYMYFDQILSCLIAAFRKRYNCQHVLIKLIENCRQALDDRQNIGLMLMDLSKAFDCLPHRLLLSKLYNYGVSLDACQLIRSYLTNRAQRVKIGSWRSEWLVINKGVPQGSILGPLLFNIFINDLLYEMQGKCQIYNYADDNTIGFSHSDINVLKEHLTQSTKTAIRWFESNHMRANPSKFQAIIMKAGHCNEPVIINVHGQDLAPSECVKLLGVFIDNKLTFHKHISTICTRASRQINAMTRVFKFLSKDSKLKLFNAFILSNFLYCSIVWHFCSNHDTYKMEKVQKRALRLVLNDYTSSYLELLEKVNRSPLYVARIKTIATEIFKCKHLKISVAIVFIRISVRISYSLYTDISPNFVKDIFTIGDQPYDLRGGSKIIQPMVNSKTFGLKTFRYEGARIWNKLPEALKNATDVNVFKNCINHWSGLTCQCGNCVICNMYLV